MKKVRIKHPDAKLVTIFHLGDPVEAELVKNTLMDHDIDCQLGGEHQAGFTGTLEISVIVREEDVEQAEEIAEIHHPHLFGHNSDND